MNPIHTFVHRVIWHRTRVKSITLQPKLCSFDSECVFFIAHWTNNELKSAALFGAVFGLETDPLRECQTAREKICISDWPQGLVFRLTTYIQKQHGFASLCHLIDAIQHGIYFSLFFLLLYNNIAAVLQSHNDLNRVEKSQPAKHCRKCAKWKQMICSACGTWHRIPIIIK